VGGHLRGWGYGARGSSPLPRLSTQNPGARSALRICGDDFNTPDESTRWEPPKRHRRICRTGVSTSSRKQRYLLRVFGDYDSSMKSSGWRSLTKRIFLPVESEFSFVDMGGIFPDERGNAVPAMAHFV
jgi:hypothetical protein